MTATVYRWTHQPSGRKAWRFAWRDSSGAWRYTTRATQADAEQAAREKLTAIQSAGLDWSQLTPDRRAFLTAVHSAVATEDQPAILASLQARTTSVDIAAAVARFLSFKITAKGRESHHLEQMRRDLDAMATHFAGHRVGDIHLGPLADWWMLRTGPAGRARQKGIRGTLVGFWNWCQREGFAGNDAITVPKRLPSITVGGGGLYVFSPEELVTILHHVRREWLPWILFGAFAGMRPEEVAPKKSTGKAGLRWDHIDWEFKVIRLPAEVSKTKRARIIPLHPVLLQWFAHLGASATWTGAVVLEDPTAARESKRLGAILDQQFHRTTGWPADALRHSYASYRNAVIRNLPQVAEEMGTSEKMLHGHYHHPKTTPEGVAWFAIDPAASSDKFRFLQTKGAETGKQMTG
jgi:integrase